MQHERVRLRVTANDEHLRGNQDEVARPAEGLRAPVPQIR